MRKLVVLVSIIILVLIFISCQKTEQEKHPNVIDKNIRIKKTQKDFIRGLYKISIGDSLNFILQSLSEPTTDELTWNGIRKLTYSFERWENEFVTDEYSLAVTLYFNESNYLVFIDYEINRKENNKSG